MPHQKKRCRHCRRTFKTNRNPSQCYCSQSACQNIRKKRWRIQKRRTDPTYLANQQEADKQWRSKHRDYWHGYRARHLEYVQKNRIKQPQRQQQQQLLAQIWQKQKIAKSDALLLKNDLVSKGYVIFVGQVEKLQRATRS